MINQVCKLVANQIWKPGLPTIYIIMPVRGAVLHYLIDNRANLALDDCGYAVTRSRNARTAALNAAG